VSKITDRIARSAGVGDLVEVLARKLPATDLQSLLLEVFRGRVSKLNANDLLRRYHDNRFVALARTDPRKLIALDQLGFDVAAPTFEPVELSPVAPLGTVSVLTGLDQNLAVATVRNTEVVSDSTNVMALECGRRRRAAPEQLVRLCATHRLLRGQQYPDPSLNAHFRLFGLCTAGRDTGSWAFELDSLREQTGFYLRLIGRLPELGLPELRPRVAVTPLEGGPPAEVIREGFLEPLAHEFQAEVALDNERSAGRGYYQALSFMISAVGRDGGDLGLVDGGFTDWTQRLLADRKERLLISGLGTERLAQLG
jgi:hypothetical protein